MSNGIKPVKDYLLMDEFVNIKKNNQFIMNNKKD
jgi:hypothetical protein